MTAQEKQLREQTFDCQACGRLIEGIELYYHPYWYCVLQKAGQLDIALTDITAQTTKSNVELLERLDSNAVELPMSGRDNEVLIPISALEAERKRIEETMS